MSWQVLLALSLYPRTQALGIASSTGSRGWWCLWRPRAPEGLHYLLWDGACPRPRQAALPFCRIPFIWGTRLPARRLVWRSGWWGTPILLQHSNVNIYVEKKKERRLGRRKFRMIFSLTVPSCVKVERWNEYAKPKPNRWHSQPQAESAVSGDSPPYCDFQPTPTHWCNF